MTHNWVFCSRVQDASKLSIHCSLPVSRRSVGAVVNVVNCEGPFSIANVFLERNEMKTPRMSLIEQCPGHLASRNCLVSPRHDPAESSRFKRQGGASVSLTSYSEVFRAYR